MSYQTRKLTEIEFPMYFSLAPNPGYNQWLLPSGITGEWDLFAGAFIRENNGTSGTWRWGSVDNSIEGKLNFQLI